MKVVVCGAGLMGITTAHALIREGMDVTVLDRGPAVAEAGASFANAGSVTVSRSGPWASPATLRKALKWLGRDDAPMQFRLRADLAQWLWALAFIRESFSGVRQARRAAMIELATLSRDLLLAQDSLPAARYRTHRTGLLTLYRDPADFAAAIDDCATLKALGVNARPLSPEQCLRTEPTLAEAQGPLAGGILAPDDVAGDALAFTRALAEDICARGGSVRCGSGVSSLLRSGAAVTGVRLETGEDIHADIVVVATGAAALSLLRPLGLRPHLAPVKGYSLTVGADPALLPRHTVADDGQKVFLTPIGDNRLRVGGVADFAGPDRRLDPARIAGLKRVAGHLFPALIRTGALSGDCAAWTGLRAMTPDGAPLLGPTPVPGLFVNFGHGSLGWTLACGSARVVADLIVGRTPPLPPGPFLAENRL